MIPLNPKDFKCRQNKKCLLSRITTFLKSIFPYKVNKFKGAVSNTYVISKTYIHNFRNMYISSHIFMKFTNTYFVWKGNLCIQMYVYKICVNARQNVLQNVTKRYKKV